MIADTRRYVDARTASKIACAIFCASITRRLDGVRIVGGAVTYVAKLDHGDAVLGCGAQNHIVEQAEGHSRSRRDRPIELAVIDRANNGGQRFRDYLLDRCAIVALKSINVRCE